MSDPVAWCLLICLFMVLALSAWAIYAEMRIQILAEKLAITDMGAKSAEAKLENHALGDPDLDAELTKDIGPGIKS